MAGLRAQERQRIVNVRYRYLLPVFRLAAVIACLIRSVWLRIPVLLLLLAWLYFWIELFVADFPAAQATR